MTKLNSKQQREHTSGVLLAMSYRENMRARVMPRWLFGYTVMLTSLRESFMGGRGERNGEEQERETEKIQYQENVTANRFYEKALWRVAKLHH